MNIKILRRDIPTHEQAEAGADHDYVIRAENGEYPEEGAGHATRHDAIVALRALYASPVWRLRRGRGGYHIDV